MSEPCERYADLIVRYLLRQLPPQDVESVKEHLAECEQCPEFVRERDFAWE
jgi:hypothetical protein